MKSKNKYVLPVKKKDIIKTRYDSPAHKGKWKYAVDYECEEGTELFASQDGEVVFVKQDSKVGGPDKKYWYDGNRVVIKHKNGEHSGYEHLKFHGAKVKVGDKVKKGQLIGYSGNTGYTFGPHLHFEIFRFTGPDKDKDFETLEVNFDKKNASNLEKKIHSFFGILFLILSGVFIPFSLTGFSIFNNSINLKFFPVIFFLIAILEIYFSVRQK